LPQLVTRKIIALGGSSVVPLPKGWLKYNNLDDGDVTELVVNRNITIRAPQKDNRPRDEKE
jgi:antitoxin component of MazEF toxin-antitoxin module